MSLAALLHRRFSPFTFIGSYDIRFVAVAPNETEGLKAALEAFPVPTSIEVRYGSDRPFDPSLIEFIRSGCSRGTAMSSLF